MDCGLATITSQADIDGQSFPPCVDQLDIVNASGVLNVTIPSLDHGHLVDINVYDSPDLLELHVPVRFLLASLKLLDTTRLETISMPNIYVPVTTLYLGPDLPFWRDYSSFELALRGARSLARVSLNTTSIGNLSVHNSRTPTGLENVAYVHELEGSPCVAYNVEAIHLCELSIFVDDDCPSIPALARLSTVHNFTITRNPHYPLSIPPSLQVNGTLMVGPSIEKAWSIVADPERQHVDLSYISTVRKDVYITSNSDFAFDLSNLAIAGGDLWITNNTNSTFDFGGLEEVGNLSLIDNMNTVLPLFPRLARADNIFLRGNIDTSPGSNIFPALNLVSGTATIEAWNSDFNCSKLVSQWRDSIIHNLVCNGTDNGTDTSSNVALTKGAQAGIGVGAGIFILALIAAGTWMMLRIRRQEKLLAEQDRAQPSLPELSGKGVIREKPDDHLRELHVAPSEVFGHQIHELHVPPVDRRVERM